MRRRFFVERFENESAVVRGETADHLGRVLRAERGQLYELSDGESVWLARVSDVQLKKHGDSEIEFALVERVAVRAPRIAIRLLIALIKFDRFEWCLEKATELGVAEIVPLAAAHSDKALIAAAQNRRTRWEKILAESAQQARLLRPPKLGEAVRAAAAFQGANAQAGILLSERPDAKPLREVLKPLENMNDIALAIGPEGGWTEDEFAAAASADFYKASLGESILRAETAVIAGASMIRLQLG